jgi:hypothetical protein
VGTPVAFLGNPQIRVKIAYAVRAGGHAIATSDAFMGINLHDSVGLSVARQHWADCHAYRFFTIVAQDREKRFPGVGERPFGDLLDPRAIESYRNIPLLLAGDRAALAADAAPEIPQKSKSFFPSHSLLIL